MPTSLPTRSFSVSSPSPRRGPRAGRRAGRRPRRRRGPRRPRRSASAYGSGSFSSWATRCSSVSPVRLLVAACCRSPARPTSPRAVSSRGRARRRRPGRPRCPRRGAGPRRRRCSRRSPRSRVRSRPTGYPAGSAHMPALKPVLRRQRRTPVGRPSRPGGRARPGSRCPAQRPGPRTAARSDLRGAEQGRVGPESRQRERDRLEGRGQRVVREAGFDLGAHQRVERAEVPAQHHDWGLKMLTMLASPCPGAVPVARSSGDGSPNPSRTSSSCATLSGGQWIASAMACAPTSVSQQPRLPQWHGRPAGLKRRWPTSPAYPPAPSSRRPPVMTPAPTPTLPET